jgi:hypothetical protein
MGAAHRWHGPKEVGSRIFRAWTENRRVGGNSAGWSGNGLRIAEVRGRRSAQPWLKSGRAPQAHPGTAAFAAAFKTKRTLLVGGDGISVEEFLSRPVSEWLAN